MYTVFFFYKQSFSVTVLSMHENNEWFDMNSCKIKYNIEEWNSLKGNGYE